MGPMKSYLEDFNLADYRLVRSYRALARINCKQAT
jgi:hypothetical protein